MPGLAGFALNPGFRAGGREIAAATLAAMQASLGRRDDAIRFPREPMAESVYATASYHRSAPFSDYDPLAQPHFPLHLDGEFYHHPELGELHRTSTSEQLAAVTAHYLRDRSARSFRVLDGIFALQAVDLERGELLLASDRYGLRPLYNYADATGFYWASEVKAFLAIPDFQPQIEPEAVEDFFRDGYLSGARTWLRGVTLFPPATVLRRSLATGETRTEQYWTWDEIATGSEPARGSMPALAAELAERLQQAVERRAGGGRRLGVTLSGGLDSRAIAAALAQAKVPFTALTFGKEGCQDIAIARAVARKLGAEHRTLELSETNWFAPRFEGVWWTDGQFDLLHMHGIEQLAECNALFDINLNGYLGDAVLGGSYRRNPKRSEVDLLLNRGRRFIRQGPLISDAYLHTRLPFFDYALLDFAYSLPNVWREGSVIYGKSLLRAYPDVFASIPWQKTGLPVGASKLRLKAHRFWRRRADALRKRLRLPRGPSRSYSDYDSWMRLPETWAAIRGLLLDANALYPHYTDADRARQAIAEHASGLPRAAVISRYLTFEIWLQQVFNRRSRAYSVEEASNDWKSGTANGRE